MRECELINLDGEWSLHMYPDEKAGQYEGVFALEEDITEQLPPAIVGQVPGSYELDLQRAGLIPDPYNGLNMQLLEKYEYYHLVYVKSFFYEEEVTGREFLRFEGVDTFAVMYLNGREVGRTDNMLIAHDIFASSLRQGLNWLVVHIEPTVLRARENNYTSLNLAIKYNYDSLYVRKSPSMYGWDICPRMVSGGLWRPVSLMRRQKLGFLQTYVYTERIVSSEEAHLQLFYEVELGRQPASRYTVEINGRCGDSSFHFSSRVWGKAGKERLYVKNPRLWWPRGYGEQALYHVCIRLFCDGEVVDEQNLRIGIRVVKLHRTSILNEHDQGEFCFEINGKPIFLLGTNWVPPDAHHALGDQRAPEILEQVLDIGCNAIRIWGGSRYELDSFYSLCDEKGVFIWHDFIMGCGNYPQTPVFCDALRQEVVWVVRQLRHHPSICLWAGDNECDINYAYHVNFTNPNDNVLTRQLIHNVLLNEDYTRPYLPSSPYYNENCYQKGVDLAPEQHLWGDRRYYKAPFYKDTSVLFASEIGYHGCPSPDSLRSFLSSDKVWDYTNDEWLLHASCPDPKPGEQFAYRNDLMANQVRVLFGEVPDDLEHFALASQISQAEAMQSFIQHFRSRKGRCTGIIWWNIRDGWPQISDAVVDYYGVKKLAYSYIHRCQRPICLMLEEREDGVLSLFGVNDTSCEQIVSYSISNYKGAVIAKGVARLPNDRAVLLKSIPAVEQQELWQICWRSAEEDGVNTFLTGTPPYSLEHYVQQCKALGMLNVEGFSSLRENDRVYMHMMA